MDPHIYRSTCNYWLTWVLVQSYRINDRTFKSSWLENRLWEWIRFELFWVAGGCQHSGNCCRNLMLMVDRKTVHTRSDFEALLQKSPEHGRFTPHYQDAHIQSFSCSKLSPNQMCTDYDNRPQVCQNYPASNFIMGLDLHDGCGYFVALKRSIPAIQNPRLCARVQSIKYVNVWD